MTFQRATPVVVIAMMLFSCGPASKSTSSAAGNTTSNSENKTYSKSQADKLDQNTFELKEISDDDSYGYTQKNPVKVGGVKNSEGPLNERRFLNALLGPNGEEVTYHRVGSCCPFDSPNGIMGGGLLDKYEVTYQGLTKPVFIYINMYDFGILKAPKGFTYKK